VFEKLRLILYILVLTIWIPIFIAVSPLWMTIILILCHDADEFKFVTKECIMRVSTLRLS
jgi:hypothetical protein